jgi:hypothetical protein
MRTAPSSCNCKRLFYSVKAADSLLWYAEDDDATAAAASVHAISVAKKAAEEARHAVDEQDTSRFAAAKTEAVRAWSDAFNALIVTIRSGNRATAAAHEAVAIVKGLYKQVVDSERLLTAAKGAESCPICMEPFGAAGAARTPCGHSFCVGCIAQWKRKKSTCPVCRGSLG